MSFPPQGSNLQRDKNIALSGQRWTLPVGFGVNKTSIMSGRPWKFGLQFWHYVEAPDAFGPDSQIRFTVTPVVSLPW